MRERILGLVLAGGAGSRLLPLTRARCKPVVSFGARFRLIDFVLSNFLLSEIRSIAVLVQHLSQPLIEHLGSRWRRPGLCRGAGLRVVPPRGFSGSARYCGTADAVWQNLDLIREQDATLVAIFGADHVYRMDVRQMIDFHRWHGAGVTLGAAPVPLSGADQLGILRVDADGVVLGYEEKPAEPSPMPATPGWAYASMGVYLVDPPLLRAALANRPAELDAHPGDSKWTLSPSIFPRGTVRAYDLRRNVVPGALPAENPGYWRDVGTRAAWWSAHMDLLGPRPRFDLENSEWPLLAESDERGRAPVVSGRIDDCLLGEGVVVEGAEIRRSVLGASVRVERGAEVDESILLDGVIVGRGARLERVIIDGPNVVPAGAVVRPGDPAGFDRIFPAGVVEDPSRLLFVPGRGQVGEA